MAERPSFQFYPGAWRNNAKLRRCSRAARSVWIDILCALHDSDEYGVLRWPLADIATSAGAPMRLVKELVTKGVLKGSDTGAVDFTHTPHTGNRAQTPVVLVKSDEGPCWFSSRLVLDEWRRKTKGFSTRFGSDQATQQVPSRVPSQRQGNGSSSSSSSSVASATDKEGSETLATQLSRLSSILNLPANDFNKHAGNLAVLQSLKLEGCDFDADILPAAQRAASGGRTVQSLRYIIPAAKESRDGRKTLASLPIPFEQTDLVGWENRVRLWRERQQSQDGLGWIEKWGPAPDQPGCKCPPSILAQVTA